jgi:hypothetical protein
VGAGGRWLVADGVRNQLETMRQLLAPRYRKSTGGYTCRAYGCEDRTDGKPYCEWHVLLHPYAAAVRLTLRRRGELGEGGIEVDETPVRRRHRARVVTVG